MATAHAFPNTLKSFKTASGKEGQFYSLPELTRSFPSVKRLPVSIRIVLESVLRNCDGKKVTKEHVEQLAQWKPHAERSDETWPQRWARTRRRSSRWCRSTWWWTTR
jgi:aconitate hydratase